MAVRVTLLSATQFNNATINVPVLNEQVPVVIKVGTVSTAEDTFTPLSLWNSISTAFASVVIMSQHGADCIRLIKDYNPTML